MTIKADLSGHTALVTGASSEGFGAHFAQTLASVGAEVVVAARRLEALESVGWANRGQRRQGARRPYGRGR